MPPVRSGLGAGRPRGRGCTVPQGTRIVPQGPTGTATSRLETGVFEIRPLVSLEIRVVADKAPQRAATRA
jgi:hypothetical protein